MFRFILKKSARALVSLFVVSILVFFATNLLPGDPATAILGRDATPERLAELREALNLDEPIIKRYLAWLGDLAQGDLGHSITLGVDSFGAGAHESRGTAVSTLVWSPLVNTAILATVSFALLVAGSLLLGTIAALRRGRPVDAFIQVVTLVLIALPEFVLGSALIIMFSFVWPVAPAVSLSVTPGTLILPVATLVLGFLGVSARLVRVGVIEVIDSNYVANTRLRGVPERRVIRSHVLPNALAPTLQVFAIATGIFVGGVVVVEYLFGYPGLGTAFVSAVSGRDYPLVQIYTLIFAGTYVIANIVAEVITVSSNPQLRERRLA